MIKLWRRARFGGMPIDGMGMSRWLMEEMVCIYWVMRDGVFGKRWFGKKLAARNDGE